MRRPSSNSTSSGAGLSAVPGVDARPDDLPPWPQRIGFIAVVLGCALAGSIEQLIVLRAIQGFAGGAMTPITQAVSFSIFPHRVMEQAQGLAFNDIFLWMGAIYLLSVPLVFLLRRLSA